MDASARTRGPIPLQHADEQELPGDAHAILHASALVTNRDQIIHGVTEQTRQMHHFGEGSKSCLLRIA